MTARGWTGAPDADFFRDLASVRRRAAAALPSADGWWLDAPAEVPCDRVEALPVVLARRLSLAEDAATNWSRDATLVASRLEDGAVFVGNAFPSLDIPAQAPVGSPPPDDGARVSGVEAMDLRARIPDLPWREGTLVLTGLVGPRRTPSVTVRLRRAKPYARDVARILDARRAVGFPRAVWPPRGATGEPPFYRAGQHTPRVKGPSGIGICGEVTSGTVFLWGSLKTTARPRELVRPNDPAEARFNAIRGTDWVDVGAPHATAVIPMTLLARHPGLPSALAFTLQVPSYSELRDGGVVEAFFGVAPAALPGFPMERGRWTFWLVSGEHLAGPLPVLIP